MQTGLVHEDLITLKEAAGRFPRLTSGRKLHLSTLYRWVSKGIGGVRLESVKAGRTRLTSVQALHRFMVRCAESDPVRRADLVESDADHERVERELARRGF